MLKQHNGDDATQNSKLFVNVTLMFQAIMEPQY